MNGFLHTLNGGRRFPLLTFLALVLMTASCQKSTGTISELELNLTVESTDDEGSESVPSTRVILSDEHLADPPNGLSISVTRYERLDSKYITYSENPVTIKWYDPASRDLEYESFELVAYLPDESQSVIYLRVYWTASDDSVRVVDPFTGQTRDSSTYTLERTRTTSSPPGPYHYEFTDLSYDAISSQAGGIIKITAGYPVGQL